MEQQLAGKQVIIHEALRMRFKLPPGFRFHPTDQELILHYLRQKAAGCLPPESAIVADVDIYKFSPWDLPERALFGEGEWFFFSPRDRKYPNGARPNRAAGVGYWKATGTDKPIIAAGGTECIGVKKALVFYKGRPPKGIKTDWVMHEYRLLENPQLPSLVTSNKNKSSMRLDDWVLCRVRLKGSIPFDVDENKENPNPNPPANKVITANHNINNLRPDATSTSPLEASFEEGTAAATTITHQEYQNLPFPLMNSGSNFDDNLDLGAPSQAMMMSSLYPTFAYDEISQLAWKNQSGGFIGGSAGEEPPPLHQTLQSLERNLSFGDLDDLIMVNPSKTSYNYNSSSFDTDESSPTASISVEQSCFFSPDDHSLHFVN